MKNYTIAATLALLTIITSSCNLDVGSGTSSSDLEAARAQATSNSNTAQDAGATGTGTEVKAAEKPAATPTSQPTVAPAAAPAPAPAPSVVAPIAPAPAPAPAVPVSTGGSLYQAGGNSITLRSDFAAVAARVDALTTVNETSPGVASSRAISAVRSGNTWVIPQSLYSYPVGNRPNTWRIVLSGTPPAGVTYHTSIMQAFVRTTDIGTGKTYPPTTRR